MILFVCTGNTCRSPMAACLYTAITGKDAASFGIHAENGASPSTEAVSAMARRGLDISGHRAGTVTMTALDEAELVLTMTEAQKVMLQYAAPKYSGKILTIAEWAGTSGDVTDPYGGNDTRYEACAAELEALIRAGTKLHGAGL